jgi:O-methyltransferase
MMVNPMEYKRMKDIYIDAELDIHFGSNEVAMEANFGAYDNTCWYEDGMYNRNYRDFSSDTDFETAYMNAVKSATSAGRDPHIRWRARTFEYFLQKSLPGNCIEIGTGHGFLFYFALLKLVKKRYDISTSHFMFIDKFDQDTVDRVTGNKTGGKTPQYADSISSVRDRFQQFGNTNVIQGLVPDILNAIEIPELKFIHIDLNAAQPEVAAMQILIPQLVPGGIIILDDYGFPETTESRVAHDLLANKLGYEILSLPTGQGLIIK